MKTKINEKDSTESLSFESSDADSFSSFRRRIKRTFLEKDDRGKNETLESLVDKLRKQNDMNRWTLTTDRFLRRGLKKDFDDMAD